MYLCLLPLTQRDRKSYIEYQKRPVVCKRYKEPICGGHHKRHESPYLNITAITICNWFKALVLHHLDCCWSAPNVIFGQGTLVEHPKSLPWTIGPLSSTNLPQQLPVTRIKAWGAYQSDESRINYDGVQDYEFFYQHIEVNVDFTLV